MDRDAPVLLARDRSLRRVEGMPDTLTLRLEAQVPQGLGGRTFVVEQRLTRRDVEKILTAFEGRGQIGTAGRRPANNTNPQ